jgi:adenylosuccinate lyase
MAELRENRSIVGARLSVLSTTIREMRDGIRKLETMERLQVGESEEAQEGGSCGGG